MPSRNSLKKRYFARGLSKISWNSKFVFYFWRKSLKVPRTAFKILWNMFRSFFPLVFHHLNIFDPLTWGFWIFPKIKVDNLRNPYHDVRIIPFYLPNLLLKIEFCKNQKSNLGETKSISHNFLRVLFWWNVKIIADTSFKFEQRLKVIL